MKVSRTVWNGESPKENGIIPDFTLSRLPIVILGFLCYTGLDPLKTRLAVVGDINRSGSVVLAATPLLKKEGIKTGSRLFDIPKRKDIHVVNPSMERYIKASNYISSLVLQYVAPEDFHAYSIDELFIDATASLHLFAQTPEELTIKSSTRFIARHG